METYLHKTKKLKDCLLKGQIKMRRCESKFLYSPMIFLPLSFLNLESPFFNFQTLRRLMPEEQQDNREGKS